MAFEDIIAVSLVGLIFFLALEKRISPLVAFLLLPFILFAYVLFAYFIYAVDSFS